MFEVVDNRPSKDWEEVGFGDVVVTDDEQKYLVIDVSLIKDEYFLGFLHLKEGYVSRDVHANYKPKYVSGQKIVEVIKASNVKLTLGE